MTAYAALMVLQALVLDPLAALPGQSLAEIHARVLHNGSDPAPDDLIVTITAAIGVVLALGNAVLGTWRRLSSLILVVWFLVILTLGAFATFANGFQLQMDVADAYFVSGGPRRFGRACFT